jgi:signal transduction histidine kinase
VTAGRLWAVFALVTVAILALATASADALARAQRESFEHRVLADAYELATRAATGSPQQVLDAVVSAKGGDACYRSAGAEYAAGAASCDWVPSARPPVLDVPGADAPPSDGRAVAAVPVGDAVLARRVSTGPLRTRVVTSWAYLYGGAAAVVVVLGVLLVRFGPRRDNTAVEKVIDMLSAVAAGEFAARAQSHGEPWERTLADQANAVAERMQVTVERQRTFVADAAHQIRNPLQALQLRLENLEPHVTAKGRRGHERLVEDVGRLGRTLDDLVAFARAEEQVAEPQAVDVLRVVQERALGWVPVAYSRDIVLRQRLPQSAVALARPGALEQALDVLLDNALKHSPARSEISLIVVPTATYVEVRVEDRGAGLPPGTEEVAAIRGWRSDPRAAGSGLGLAIASLLLSSSGGSLQLRDRTDGAGLSAVIRLPTPAPVVPDQHRPAWAVNAGEWHED